MTQNRFYSSTALPTTLFATINSSITTVQVVSDAGVPASYPFSILAEWGTVNQEVITVTQAPSTGSGYFEFDNCIRGADGTTAVGHSAGAQVVHGVSARDYNEPQAHIATPSLHVPLDSTDAALPLGIAAAGTVGQSADAGHVHSMPLVPTAVKTGAYNAAGHDFVLVDTTSGNVTITAPAAPADKTVIGVKMVALGTGNSVSFAASSTDVFNVAGGPASVSLIRLYQTVIVQYKSSAGIWVVQSTDPAISIDTTATDIQPMGTLAAGSAGKAADAGHVHPAPGDTLADNALLAASASVASAQSGNLTTAGTLFLVKIPIRAAITATSLQFFTAAASSGASTGTFAGLYSSAGTLLSGSADTGTWASGVKTVALTTPQALAAGTFVWAAILTNLATTQPSIRVFSGGSGITANLNLAASVYRAAVNGTGLTALPGTITPASNSQGSATPYWVGII